MPLEQAVPQVHDLVSFLNLLRDELNWPLPFDAAPTELTFDWSAEGDLHVNEGSAQHLKDGIVRQLRPLEGNQPWGIFLVEFTDGRIYRTALRQILRGLVPNRRRSAHFPVWNRENLLFICTTHDYDRFTFAHFRGDVSQRAILSTFGWDRSETALRTLCEFNLKALQFPEHPADSVCWLQQWQEAFKVEKVTEEFFRVYRNVFDDVVGAIGGRDVGAIHELPLRQEEESGRLFVQKLFNRLMFIRFLEKKGWLSLKGRKDYLQALWDDYQATKHQTSNPSFNRDRLKLLFFSGLSTPNEVNLIGINRGGLLRELIGEVPYLNGGLFEEEMDDRDPQIVVPDEAIEPILKKLFYRFNFTVTESTPLDIEVAVDPEMLGRIFEELVTGRHESGSYYTPKPIVAFMCRESLKGYLGDVLPRESREAIETFVEKRDPSMLIDPEAALEGLKQVRVCDPACGSGAYLVGMLHELLELRACLFAARKLDAKTVYERKLEIIQNNVYGVDIDPFAVNIARLRLWLSLVVDFEGENPPPLPNLDFKIGTGDSLTARNPSGGLSTDMFRKNQIERYYKLKEQFLVAHHGEKRALRTEIDRLRQEIAKWVHPDELIQGFDWAVEFAEVFRDGGFDIVLTNPPYVRQELLGREYKENALKPIYSEVYMGTADLYIYFYARAHQLLRPNGVSCFISSNKWLRAGYGEKSRQHLLDAQAFHLIVDFGDQPVFKATAYPCIFLWQKQPRKDTPTAWAEVKDLQTCYSEGIREHISRIAQIIPASQFGKNKPRLATSAAADRRTKMETSGPRLGELVKRQIFRGVLTGLNEAFIIDRATRDRLIAEDPKSAEVIKPLLAGDDVRRYEVHFRETYLIWTYIGVPIKEYPAIFEHLRKFWAKAEKRWDKGHHWWELRACDYYAAFERPKIVYPVISTVPRFTIDSSSHYCNDKAFILPTGDWYWLGILNSKSVLLWVTENLSPLRGGYYEFRAVYMETLPIPDASKTDREVVAKLAKETQSLHMQRRKRVEQFLCDLGTSPAESSSRNPLERPWTLTPEEFTKRAKAIHVGAIHELPHFKAVHDKTAALTEQITRIEHEIDERVAALYGVELGE
jgi:type I restriction-modification system DNA methylase subunit